MNRETAWMIRQDGKAFACTSHYYADSEDAEDTLYAAEWLYKHTARCGTKCLILNLISAYAEGLSRGDSGHEYPGYNGDTVHDLMIDIEDKQYNFLTADFVLAVADKLPTGINMNVRELNSLVIKALNEEFLRARLGGMYDTIEGSLDMFFRVSAAGFDWMPIIKRFVHENSERIGTVTVLWDYESTGRKDFFKDEKGRDINKIPISEFI